VQRTKFHEIRFRSARKSRTQGKCQTTQRSIGPDAEMALVGTRYKGVPMRFSDPVLRNDP
jgi:hypothetical protein